ncbi:MAG: GTPase Era, partial [Sphingomonadales bacterium]
MTGNGNENNPPMRCGVIAVIGAPNAGKSTLVNALVGTKVAIVSHKVQTTRARLMGIAMADEAQLVLVDTPGIFAPKRRLDRAMVQTAWGEVGDADQIVLMIDARRGITEDVERILEGLDAIKAPVILALNKVDELKDKSKLLRLAEQLTARRNFAEIFMISALDGSGVADLKAYLKAQVPEGPWLFPEDQV